MISKLGVVPLLALITSLLSACANIGTYQAAIRAATIMGIQQIKNAHDDELYVTQELVCNNSIGAVMRTPDAMRRNLIFQMCGGEAAPVTPGIVLVPPVSMKNGAAGSAQLGQ